LLDELLPDREANDAVFRLALSVLAQLRGKDFWLPITYFDLWMARLMGYLPDLSECLSCGRSLNGDRAYFHALADGLMCPEHKRLASSELSAESRKLAAQMLRAPLSTIDTAGPQKTGADLRKFLLQLLERSIDKKLVTRGMLERMS
jgi:DNA repair protein RecO (recombination protein O)